MKPSKDFDSTLISEKENFLLENDMYKLSLHEKTQSLLKLQPTTLSDNQDISATFKDERSISEIDDTPWREMQIQQLIHDFMIISSSSLLISFSYFSGLVIMLMNLHFIGLTNDPVLISAVGLGNMWINSIGINSIYGLNYGFEAQASKAYGAEDFKQVGIFYKKALLLVLLVSAIFSVLSVAAGPLFELLGQSPDVCYELKEYVLCLLPAFLFTGIFDLRSLFFNAQEIFRAPICIQVLTTVGHLGWCILFNNMGLETKGIAFAMDITCFLNMILLEIYSFFWSPRSQSRVPWSKEVFKGFEEYLRLTLPIAFTTVLEEFSYEVNSVFAGLLGEEILAAHVAMANSGALFYCLAEGFSTGISTYVGIAIGEKKKNKAKRFAVFGVMGGILIVVFCYLFLWIFKYQWASFFTDDSNVDDLMVGALPYFVITGLIDNFQLCIGSILIITGRGKFTLILYFACLYVVANPLSFVLGNVSGLDLNGIWLGIIGGESLLAVSFLIMVLRINWQKEIDLADQNEEIKDLMEEKGK